MTAKSCTCLTAPALLCVTGCLRNAIGKKPLGSGRTIAAVVLAIPAWTICTYNLKNLQLTKSFPIGAQRGHDGLQAFVGTVKRFALVQMRSLWRFYEDYQMKHKLILVGGVVASAIVSVTVLWWAWSLIVALVEVV